MTVAQIMEKMISFSEGNIHDIDHFLRVWSYAKTIGEIENPYAQIIRTIPTIQQLSSHNLGSGRYTALQILCSVPKSASSGSSNGHYNCNELFRL